MADCHSHNDSARNVNARSRVELCPEYLRGLVEYNPDTGHITYLQRTEEDFLGSTNPTKSAEYFNKTFAGQRALTTKNGAGYHCGSVGGVHTMAHRVAWVLHHGHEPDVIDHINGDRTDNRICNLRSVSSRGNARNSGVRTNSPNVITGIIDAKPKAWGARWRVVRAENGAILGTKMFHCIGEAIKFRNKDLRERGFFPMHGIRPSARSDKRQNERLKKRCGADLQVVQS